MPNEEGLTLADIERETDRFLMPATEKEADILRAAVDLLGERGVDGATTAEIAKRAGVTERTLFRYFPSKRDLVRRVLAPTILRTILTREWRPFGALLDGSAADGGERPMFVSERFAGIATNPPVARALFGELTRLTHEQDDLNTEFGRLELEQATWAEPNRIEQIARGQLGMVNPGATDTVVVKQ